MTRARPEEALHRAVAEFLTLALPEDAWFTTFPAGGGGKVRGSILKGMGLKPGVPDILIIYQGKALWIELKAWNGRLSGSQRTAIADIMNAGCPAYVTNSIESVQDILQLRGIPLRASVRAEL